MKVLYSNPALAADRSGSDDVCYLECGEKGIFLSRIVSSLELLMEEDHSNEHSE